MKIGDARRIYGTQLNELRQRQQELLKLQKEQQKNGGVHFTDEEREGVILELSAVQKEYDVAQECMNKLIDYSVALHNAEVVRRQGEAMEDMSDEMAKCMEIARRLANGDKVPAKDEKKLMEFNFKLYMASKNAGAIRQNEKQKKYKSLWEDEEENSRGIPDIEYIEDIEEKIDGMDVPMELTSESVN